jgi:hypothetical protein
LASLIAGSLAMVVAWLLYRHGWFNFALRNRTDLTPADRAAARIAAAATAPLLLAVALWQSLCLFVPFVAAICSAHPTRAVPFILIAWVTTPLILVPLYWSLALDADQSRRIFPHRAGAVWVAPVLWLLAGLVAWCVMHWR